MEFEEKIELFNSEFDINNKNILLKNITNIFKENIPQIDQNISIFFDKINLTQTLYGEFILKKWLSVPLTDTKILKNRQKNIKKCFKNANILDKLLEKLHKKENKILWFWNEINDDIQSIYDIIYCNFSSYANIPFFGSQHINKMEKIMNCDENALNIMNMYSIFVSPITTILIPLLSFIIPYIILLFYNPKTNIKITDYTLILYQMINTYFKGNISFYSTIITGIYIFLYLQSGYTSLTKAMETNKIINILHNKINNVARLIKITTEIKKYIDEQTTIKISININNELNYFNNIFNNKVFEKDPQLFNNKGKILSVYYNFINNKDKLISILKYIGEIDVYHSLTKLFIDSSNNSKYCFTKYFTKTRPIIIAKKLWHPNIKSNEIKYHNITLGKNIKNMLITGPNKAGKSVFMKNILISILLSQTIGIAPAEKFVITPFTLINSYLHLIDNVGKESLFEAEINRTKKYFSLLHDLKENQFAFIIMDEIFTSTNNKEGQQAAYITCKKLCEYKNSISIITTHFTELDKLENETNKRISNYKFSIIREENGKIIYPRILEKGYSKQYNALELFGV